MKNKTKDLMKDLNKSITEQLVDAAAKVSKDFKEVKNEEAPTTNNEVEIGADMLKLLKELTDNLHKQAVSNLEEKRIIRNMWCRKYILGKWYNKWFYCLKFKRSITEYMLCAGEQYYIENEFTNVFKPLENIEEIITKKEE